MLKKCRTDYYSMYRHFFNFICVTFFVVGCTVTPELVPQSKMAKLSSSLYILGASQKESIKLSRDIFQKTTALTKEFELTSPPWWHNTLVNIGVRKKGLCYHWSDALYLHLLTQGYTSVEFHLVVANIGEYLWEHNALVVVKKGGKVEEGIVVDAWRDSGKLYFSKVKEDRKYKWSHRSERGCKAIR